MKTAKQVAEEIALALGYPRHADSYPFAVDRVQATLEDYARERMEAMRQACAVRVYGLGPDEYEAERYRGIVLSTPIPGEGAPA